MLNKRKKVMDPTIINNYNKFLTTLDKKSNLYVNPNINTNIDNLENIKETKKSDKLKKEIDKILTNVANKYNINNYNSSNFTGQTIND